MSAAAEDDVVQAPPQPPSPLPDEAFYAPLVVDGIDGDEGGEAMPQAPSKDSMTELFSSLSARMSEAVRVSRSAVSAVVPNINRGTSIPTVMFFGDSITERGSEVADEDGPGWVARLQGEYAGRADFYARGFSGYNSRWALHMLPRLVQGLPSTAGLKAVTIFFGANDAVIESEPNYVPLKEYVANLRKLANFVRAIRRTDPVVPVLITPPPVRQDRDGDVPRRFSARTEEYAAACVAVAEEIGCPALDLHSAMNAQLSADGVAPELMQEGLDRYLNDGLHLNADGNKFVAEMVIATFKKHIPGLHPDELQKTYPHWTAVDPIKPAAALGTSALV